MQRWRILQSALPNGISIQKAIALVVALAKLHNFCIDQSRERDAGIPEVLATDQVTHITANGGFVALDEVPNADAPVPTQLLGGGEHFDDIPLPQRRTRNASEYEKSLPRYRLLQKVIDSHMVRPHANVDRHN